MNRALIVQSFKPDIEVVGFSEAQDVQTMREALKNLYLSQPVDCADAAAVFRFMALRAAKVPGDHVLTGSKRLLSRPHKELVKVLLQMGCEAELQEDALKIKSYGWCPQGDGLWISGAESSQVASGLFLSAWGLRAPMHINISDQMVSEGYFKMTVEVLRRFGMEIFNHGLEWTIPAQQTPHAGTYMVEIDVSSAFAVAAMAAVGGEARIRNFPVNSLQPDAIFVEHLAKMGIPVQQNGQELKISQAQKWSGIDVDLKNTPDLFPVLSVLCALASSPSIITGIKHVAFKESDRLKKSMELVAKMGGIINIVNENTVSIHPTRQRNQSFDFTPDKDHRMAMAGAVAKRAGFAVKIRTPEVVNKSFPEFWQIAGELS
jgi:3-phosphoshikimate 1-carboxyvinyltransferase